MVGKPGKKKFKAGTRWLIGSVLLALISLTGTLLYPLVLNRSGDAVPVSVVKVQRGDVESAINESGAVELRGQITLKSPIEGGIDQVFVQPRARVRAGQTLVTLRYPERQTALANQQLQIQQQERSLDRSRQRVQEAGEQLTVEQQKLKNLIALVKEGAIEKQRFQDQEDRVRSTRNALRDAQAALDTASLELQRSELELQRITQQLQNSVITAPMDGVVLDVKVSNGDGVQFRTELLTLGDPNQEYIQLQLSTLDATRVRVNQLVRVSVIGPDAKTYTGRIQSLYPQAVVPEQAKQGNSRQSSQASVPATVKLDKPTRTLIPGSQVSVEIVLEQRRNVVTLNTEAIQRSQDSPFVWVRNSSGKVQKQAIKTGLEGLLAVEVLSGVNPGDEVVIPPVEPPLKPGMAVTTEKKGK